MCPSRNDASPKANMSRGSIRNTSPSSDRTSATANAARRESYAGCSASATPVSSASVSGLQAYSRGLRRVATANQSATAVTAASASRMAAVLVVAPLLSCLVARVRECRALGAEARHGPPCGLAHGGIGIAVARGAQRWKGGAVTRVAECDGGVAREPRTPRAPHGGMTEALTECVVVELQALDEVGERHRSARRRRAGVG